MGLEVLYSEQFQKTLPFVYLDEFYAFLKGSFDQDITVDMKTENNKWTLSFDYQDEATGETTNYSMSMMA